MTVWVTSDLHFGHKNIMNHCPPRGVAFDNDVDQMTAGLISRWNQRVAKDDIVWVVGDFAWKPDVGEYAFGELNGYKHLILGNHDGRHVQRLGWESIQTYYELEYAGTKLVMFHYPIQVWNGAHKGALHLHGHSHGNTAPVGGRADIGVDLHYNLAPFTMEEAITYASWKPYESSDHH